MMKQLEPRPRQREPAVNSITDTKHPLRLILWLGLIISRMLEGSTTRRSFTTCVLLFHKFYLNVLHNPHVR